MLSLQHREIIKLSIPILETGGEVLTTHFYRILLQEHPEVRPLFNQVHQSSGAQPKALANGILMYARHIDRLEELGPLANQIISKHVSLQVLPEHYPIVGNCLLRAIREVLGEEIATEAVLAAWSAAYQQLADLLISAEEQAYVDKEKATGGWRGARAFKVTHKVRESECIMSCYLVPVDGKAVITHVPGQYIGLQLSINGVEVRRNYSLSAEPDGSTLRISVKREPYGVASHFLHDTLSEGDVVNVFPPSGEFMLNDSQRPLVLISGGVGITPTVAMVNAALKTGRQIYFIHCARNDKVHAFREHVDQLAMAYPQLKRFYCYDEEVPGADDAYGAGPLSVAHLEKWLPATRDLDVYFLGPKPFMTMVKRQLNTLGIPPPQCRYEFFGPASALD